MNLQSNDFELFGLPMRFAQDAATLDERWKALQREIHPNEKLITKGKRGDLHARRTVLKKVTDKFAV